MVFNRRNLLAGAGASALLAGTNAHAVVRFDVTSGNVQPMPIALPDFLPGSSAETDTSRNITSIIAANLQRSGLFAPINPAAYIEKISNSDAVPRFPDWKAINAQALVIGRITRQGDGRLKAEFRLWDVFAGQQLTGQQYFTTPDNWRRVAHIISDAVYERLTGEKGYFDSRIVFVDESGPKDRRVKRLALMDQDGAGLRYLTRGDDLVLTPRFNPSTQEITYMSYGQGDPRVFLLNIETGQREIVGDFPGHDVRAAFLAGWPARDHVAVARRQRQSVRDGLALEGNHASHQHAGDRHVALLFAGRLAHLLRKRSRRLATDLCHGSIGRAGAARLVRQCALLDAGVVAARRLHRLHPAVERLVRHRRDEARWLRRAPADRRLPQ